MWSWLEGICISNRTILLKCLSCKSSFTSLMIFEYDIINYNWWRLTCMIFAITRFVIAKSLFSIGVWISDIFPCECLWVAYWVNFMLLSVYWYNLWVGLNVSKLSLISLQSDFWSIFLLFFLSLSLTSKTCALEKRTTILKNGWSGVKINTMSSVSTSVIFLFFSYNYDFLLKKVIKMVRFLGKNNAFWIF